MRRPLLLLFGLLAAAGFIVLAGSGCTTHDPADSSIPWGRPATWEGQPPGMSGF